MARVAPRAVPPSVVAVFLNWQSGSLRSPAVALFVPCGFWQPALFGSLERNLNSRRDDSI
jgi:hypothetical protein